MTPIFIVYGMLVLSICMTIQLEAHLDSWFILNMRRLPYIITDIDGVLLRGKNQIDGTA